MRQWLLAGGILIALMGSAVAEHPRYWGQIIARDGMHLTVELKSGRQVGVDASIALATGMSVPLDVGDNIAIAGAMENNEIKATGIVHAFGRETWPDD